MPTRPSFEIKRVYDGATQGTHRVLVDRLWPRGVSKARAAIDEWSKDVAPSDGLRRWYGHEPDKFSEFARRYRGELSQGAGKSAVGELRDIAKEKPVILVTATKDLDHSGATVLLDVLEGRRTRAQS